ncbi:hypothetical protein [Paenibacillus oleatilyticus]|uniref:DUF4230 domain-containing protein n=1 Tax=Paenibacillus oleatilyticus TaxID=2594886 RepID=A0ABV4UVL1_9BACL|nr:hypothetical protein [Paenibacillus oleatilyticus]MBU7315888.1 hypothetical protein [Paenibacillus oleatilyticus]
MKWAPRLFIITALSIAVASALSYLSQLDESLSVFRTVKAHPVSENNIVDVVSRMQLHLRIRRVEVNHAVVSIDLLAVKTSDKSDMLSDMYEVPTVMFASSTNINQVLVRVLDASGDREGNPQPLAAVDARRERWLPNEAGLRTRNAEELQQYLDTRFRMTYTSKWQERFTPKS